MYLMENTIIYEAEPQNGSHTIYLSFGLSILSASILKPTNSFHIVLIILCVHVKFFDKESQNLQAFYTH